MPKARHRETPKEGVLGFPTEAEATRDGLVREPHQSPASFATKNR
ncbi:hypothetical protein HNP60_003341 [Sphingobium sp. B1D3A]|uniref:Transposase n=1 Tax=Sphingobium lignivorans TaxID=2735886 RepID=A0ABR6NL27_9SPHN|nr:hypothetical protein [Sphingobium lignivorans]